MQTDTYVEVVGKATAADEKALVAHIATVVGTSQTGANGVTGAVTKCLRFEPHAAAEQSFGTDFFWVVYYRIG